jgi:acyl-CoA thioester hydrolase
MARMGGTFRTDVRVRLAETDALGVVYYGQYLTYFDVSRVEMLREAGITPGFLRTRKLGFVAAAAYCRYRASARLDDRLTLKVKIEKIGSSSVTYAHEITRDKTMVAEGRVTDVLVGRRGTPASIPDDIRRLLGRYT